MEPTMSAHPTVEPTVRNGFPDDILDIVIEHLWRGHGSREDLILAVQIATTSLRLLRGARKRLYSHVGQDPGQIESIIRHSELGKYVRTIEWIENSKVEKDKGFRISKPFRRFVE